MTVRDGLLALLDGGPRHGYQLKTEFEAATGGVWSLNVGQVYTTLDRLARDGLVAVETGDTEGDQKRYSLTAAGREALGAWWEAVPGENPLPRDELQLKVLMAVERGPDHALEVITHQRTALFRLLQARRRNGGGRASARSGGRRSEPASEAEAARAELAAGMVTDALVVRAEADLRWLDLCEARLQKPRPKSDRT